VTGGGEPPVALVIGRAGRDGLELKEQDEIADKSWLTFLRSLPLRQTSSREHTTTSRE